MSQTLEELNVGTYDNMHIVRLAGISYDISSNALLVDRRGHDRDRCAEPIRQIPRLCIARGRQSTTTGEHLLEIRCHRK